MTQRVTAPEALSRHAPAPVAPWIERVFGDVHSRRRWKLGLIRVFIIANLLLGGNYIIWRYTSSINWDFWPWALMLIVAETYSFMEAVFFGTTLWKLRERDAPPLPRGDETVDVFVCCYNEPVDVVRATIRASVAITHPHRTWLLDDGDSAEMRAMTEAEGAGYIVRSLEWRNRSRHAKAGNLNNALFQTSGEFCLVLDADQIPLPHILDRTLGFFEDPKVAFVQTPQWFRNVPPGDPYGSEAPLFYGPILQGKDGWNAAFFCGSNAVLRREALMYGGVVNYAVELERRIRAALVASDRVLRKAANVLEGPERLRFHGTIEELRRAIGDARRNLREKVPLQEVTWTFQRQVEASARGIVSADLRSIRAELADIPGIDASDDIDMQLSSLLDNQAALNDLTRRDTSPLAAIEAVRGMILAIDVDREEEAMPISPLATISVTEDLATAMRLHSLGWTSIYHNEVLAEGLAPEDLRTAFSQRLRWAQGNIQVMLKENPIAMKGLSLGQRIMYLTTSWTYLSGFFAVIYLIAPVGFLLFGWRPVNAWSDDFFWRLIPFLIVNQLLFLIVGWKLRTFRGMQYSLALFPLWIQAVISAVRSVYFGGKLSFVVTSKTRQEGAPWRLIRTQLIFMGLLVVACLYGLGRIVSGNAENDTSAILINVVWAVYDLAMLSVLIVAATYKMPDNTGEDELAGAAATLRGRAAGVR
jgi:cellulose synthase (UDP-forming)